jgi:hypothetical protein
VDATGPRRLLSLSSPTVALANVVLVVALTAMVFLSSVVLGFDGAAYDWAFVGVGIVALATGAALQVERRWSYLSALTLLDVTAIALVGAAASWVSRQHGPSPLGDEPHYVPVITGQQASADQILTRYVGPGPGHAWLNADHTWIPWIGYGVLVIFVMMIGTLVGDMVVMARRGARGAS